MQQLNQLKDYYRGLDSHLRKEEEVFFPVLEKNGMQEHPANLRKEHKKFRGALSKVIEMLEGVAIDRPYFSIEEVVGIREGFILEISNHIFRETFIFYPAALEFIIDTNQWEKIKEGFKQLKLC